MEINHIKHKIKIALDSVKELDEPYKLETYKIILTSSLSDSLSSSEENNGQKDNKFTPKTDKLSKSDHDITKLSNLCKITTRELFDVLKFDNNEVILKKVLTGTEAEQQISGSQLILLGYEIGLGTSEISSKTLKGVLKKSNIADKGRNFAQNLKRRKDLFSMSSKSSGVNLYSLTANKGRTSTIELLTKLAKGEQIEN
ncbi:MAG: hypothetical protein OER82_02045 [Nitrosopumilus sp.]|nr:hypothetical protein [Nitrosopumilus sp.]